MIETLEPGGIARRLLLRRALGAGIVVVIGSRTAEAADAEVVIDNFTFSPTPLKVKVGTTVTWVNHDDIPHSLVCPNAEGAFASAGYRRQRSPTRSSRRGHTTTCADCIRTCMARWWWKPDGVIVPLPCR